MYSPIPQSGSPFPPTVKLPGLHIWRVEKLKPVPVAPENYGIFFSGDSYLVLHNGPEELSHLHLWIGQQSSRDEQGAAPYWPCTSTPCSESGLCSTESHRAMSPTSS